MKILEEVSNHSFFDSFSYKITVHKTLLTLVNEIEELKKEIEKLKGEKKDV
jgi:hypothetical protein